MARRSGVMWASPDHSRSATCSATHSAVWKRITAAVKRLNAADASDYVKLSIAAKAYFMHGKASRPTTPEELSKMGQQFGWKVSEQQLQEANEWLETLDLVETAPTT